VNATPVQASNPPGIERPASGLGSLQFKFPFRKYQRLILARMETEQKDHKYHIVAPPGSGKTIVGIELMRRFNAPAVVFAPTTTIQMQWQAKVGMFLENDRDLPRLTSTSAQALAPINIFTYQIISTPGEEQAHESAIAVEQWVQDLLREGRAADEASARARIETLKANNPDSHRKELARRYQRTKKKLLQADAAEIVRFLHPNALALIRDLEIYGVRTVVLDECHHLLDYWAIVLRYLVARIPDVRVVGLTATLPSPEDDLEYENYTALLGEVDFEIPTPAVVKEGDLAPYRDLVYFVEPSQAEMDYLYNIQQAFENIISETTSSAAFRTWVDGYLAAETDWAVFLNEQPLFSLALLRYIRRTGKILPTDAPLPVEAAHEMSIEDWVYLLEKYGLNVLKLSADKEDHLQLARLRRALLPFGFTLTERGMRQSRSAGELVLTFSESKDQAVAHILEVEHQSMQDRLRAVIITDFERMSSGVRRVKGVLEPDAGSALRLFRHISEERKLSPLNAVLLTGSNLLVTSANADAALAAFDGYLKQMGLRAKLSVRDTESAAMKAIQGTGQDWAPRTYVRMLTELFDQGICRCLVGTRGILGEGWDSVTLNTLIDLTSVTTSTGVQQLRGRGIRKDPQWPRKVAHNWDVICVAPDFEKGHADLRRLIARHSRYWGIIDVSAAGQLQQDVSDALNQGITALAGNTRVPDPGTPDPWLGPQIRGQVVKGLVHVNPDLAYKLAVQGFKRINYRAYNGRMLAAAKNRERTYALWGIGDEYSNFSYAASRLDARDLKIRTVFSIQNSLKRMLRAFSASVLMGLLVSANYAFQLSRPFMEAGPWWPAVLTTLIVLGALITFLLNLRAAITIGRKLLVTQPPDAILLDAGRALLKSLQEAGLVSRNLQSDYLRVIEQPDSSYQVLLDYASPEDAAEFIRAYGEMFDPVIDQRYLISRSDQRLPQLALMPLWLLLRNTFRESGAYQPSYHPVPRVLSTRKELAVIFSTHWQRYVGGGELVFTRTETGRGILLAARAQRRPNVKGLAFEIWK
jgi:superfamily II DNA or RNA helicase